MSRSTGSHLMDGIRVLGYELDLRLKGDVGYILLPGKDSWDDLEFAVAHDVRNSLLIKGALE